MDMQLTIFMQLASASKTEPDTPKMDITFSDKLHIRDIDSPESLNIRERLKRIRSENPRLYKAFRTGNFD